MDPLLVDGALVLTAAEPALASLLQAFFPVVSLPRGKAALRRRINAAVRRPSASSTLPLLRSG
jgi:hypothetical protein